MKCYILLVMLGVCSSKYIFKNDNNLQPEQIHLSFGEKTNDIVATWSTLNDTASVVRYGVSAPDQAATGESTVFIDGGQMKRRQWIHRATMKDLDFDTRYVYQVGSEDGWSQQWSFKTPPAGEDWVVRVAIYGDMGLNDSKSLPFLKRDVSQGKYDLILHVGDFAYDMNEEEGQVGDKFMRKLQPLAAALPYMTCPGNHESAYNFSHYSSRFSMPGPASNLYYSFDVGPVHFVSISTEVYYFTEYGLKLMVEQYEWLKKDLTIAAMDANRRRRPWIVLFGHRPMYCSNSDDVDCSLEYTRTGFLGLFGLEPLLNQFGVDLVVWAHEHSYERTWPLYDRTVYNGSYHAPYLNPRAPIHVVTGSAGCREGTDRFVKQPAAWSAFRSSDYGYTRFAAHNRTHIYIEQVSVEHVKARATKPDVIDSFWIVKELHEPYDIAPVHIVTGSAGCREGRDHFRRNPFKWSAFHSQDYGYTKFKAFNKTHINIEQISVDLGGEVIDKFWLVKNKTLSFNDL